MKSTSRRSFLEASLASACGALLASGCRHPDQKRGAPHRAATDPLTTHDPHLYLFVDDRWIEKAEQLTRVVHQPEPLPAPVIFPDDPGTQSEFAWGNVIREGGKFRMWYGTMMLGDRGGGHHEMARAGVWGSGADFGFYPRSKADVRPTQATLGKYAESTDGIHWRKPELGLFEFQRSRRNNIILTGARAAEQTGGALTNFDGYTIVRDDAEANPEKRYKMIAHWETIHCHDNKAISGSLGRDEKILERFRAARGKYIMYSPDGIHWDGPLQRVHFPDGGGDRFLVVRDHRHSRWFGYSRIAKHSAAAFSYSTNLIDWSPPVVEQLFTPATLRAPKVECLVPFNYGNQDLGVPVGMDKDRSAVEGARAMIPFLASHHDGEPWGFVGDGAPLIPMGPPGSYYATGAVPLHNEPFIVGDELLLYFNAFSRYQEPPCPYGKRTIGVAKLRRDGFAGLKHRPGDAAGTLLTPAIEVGGGELTLNVQPGTGGGRVEVALLHPDGVALSGFDFGSSIPVEDDRVRAPILWQRGPRLERLQGQRVRLAFRLHGEVTLYAFAFS